MKVLSIGNSFSFDAHRYLQRLAKKDGVALKTVNLHIGGCTLRTHYLNMLKGEPNYAFCFNGEETGIKVSISEALASDDWDIVTLQQASHDSMKYETYTPYIEELAEYIRKYCPHAKLFIHETWGYEDGSERLKNVGYESEKEMYDSIKKCYRKAATAIKADGFIPCGKAMLLAPQFGARIVRRDTFHASLGAGRYLLALTWYKALTGRDITDNDFSDFDEPVEEEVRAAVIKSVNAAFEELESEKLFGKTVVFLGDSLTEGVLGTSSVKNRYTEVFANLSGAKVYTYGVGGTRIAYQQKPTAYKPWHDMYFASRVKYMTDNADYVVVFGGSNDFDGGDAPLGTIEDRTLETFYGALFDLFERLKAKYPNATIIAVTPVHRIEEKNPINKVGCERKGGMAVYADAIIQVAEKFGIKVVDAFREWEMNPLFSEQKEKYFSADGVHPNDNGHRFIAEKLVEFIGNIE